jgi:large subunit ribosomal protein L13
MTNFIKKNEIKNNWVLINAENAIVGRLAAYITKILRGKNKSQFTPNMDIGDFVIVTNIEKIKFTGKKFNNKKYYRHTGYPGGIKSTTPALLSNKKPQEILKLAVKRMLPGGPLAKKQLSKLKIYKGSVHPHESQNPTIIDFAKMNAKNYQSIN